MTSDEVGRLEGAINNLRAELTALVEHELRPFVVRNDTDHAEIKANQQKTNTRVSALEIWRARFEGAFFAGRILWAVLGVGLTIVGLLLRGQIGG